MNFLANFEKRWIEREEDGWKKEKTKEVYIHDGRVVAWKELPSHLKFARRLRWSLQNNFNLKLSAVVEVLEPEI